MHQRYVKEEKTLNISTCEAKSAELFSEHAQREEGAKGE